MDARGALLLVLSLAAACEDEDPCERARRAYESFVDDHAACTVADDCAPVGGGYWCNVRIIGFAAVNRSSLTRAEELSMAPNGCRYGGGTDGPRYGAATCVAGRCAPVQTGWCPSLPMSDAGSDGGAQPALDASDLDATTP